MSLVKVGQSSDFVELQVCPVGLKLIGLRQSQILFWPLYLLMVKISLNFLFAT